ncbi:hypothetical protein V5O48_008966 [Marasmius crinis-equi]|uniref:Uncharacterized protein n=1 Tax=Marasmius crinis-equi TaxID=585013 RepID=A0ABR3FD22_9AGAR
MSGHGLKWGREMVNGVDVTELRDELEICDMMGDTAVWCHIHDLDAKMRKARAEVKERLAVAKEDSLRERLEGEMKRLDIEETESRKKIDTERDDWLERARKIRQQMSELGLTPPPKPETVEEAVERQLKEEGWEQQMLRKLSEM